MKTHLRSESKSNQQTLKSQSAQWVKVCSTREIPFGTTKVWRHRGKQIAIFSISRGYLACNNRCPHQNFPLSEGCITEDGILTCNWHNWKFDVSAEGKNLKGGENVRTYPLKVLGDEIWIDVQDPPFNEQYANLLKSLKKSVRNNSYEHIARELSRLQLLGVDLAELVAHAIEWTFDRLEYGWTHAYAGAADWLTLFDAHRDGAEKQLICILEAVGHMADDTLRRPIYSYPTHSQPYSSTEFLAAIEREDEAKAVSLLRGALNQGLHFTNLEGDLSAAALAHYNDFGHALIYVEKAGQLISRLGNRVELPVLLALTRTLVYTTREDQIPKFRTYASALNRWDPNRDKMASRWQDFNGLSINQSLEKTQSVSALNPETIYDLLLAANANNMLHFDVDLQESITSNIDDNVGWLDFTHTLTFAHAVRTQCAKFPQLWPPALLQMACFLGRNNPYVDLNSPHDKWVVINPQAFYDGALESLFDHGKDEFIVSVHLLKTLMAARAESIHTEKETSQLVNAALNRFLASPMKRKHVLRTARQARQSVSMDEQF